MATLHTTWDVWKVVIKRASGMTVKQKSNTATFTSVRQVLRNYEQQNETCNALIQSLTN